MTCMSRFQISFITIIISQLKKEEFVHLIICFFFVKCEDLTKKIHEEVFETIRELSKVRKLTKIHRQFT